MNVFESAQRIASDLAKQKENIMLEQLNELVSRGLLVCESNEPVLLMEDGKLLYKQMVRLKLRDQEYIEQLESKIKKLEKTLSDIRFAFAQIDLPAGDE